MQNLVKFYSNKYLQWILIYELKKFNLPLWTFIVKEFFLIIKNYCAGKIVHLLFTSFSIRVMLENVPSKYEHWV